MSSAPGGPFAALKGLAASVLATGQTRLQLLGNEIQTEKLRVLRLLGFAAGVMFCVGLAVLLAIGLALALFWEQRVAVLAVLTLLFAALGGFFYHSLRRASEDDESIFAASLAELQEDLRHLKAAAAPGHEKKPR